MAAAIAVVLSWAAPASSVTTVPYVFSPNTPARASEINANFAAVASAIDALDAANASRFGAVEMRLSALESRDDFVPSGTIAFFAAAACPSGWTEHTQAQGRYVVAMPTGGTVGGTVGTAMTDRQNLTHAHSIAHRHQWANFDAGSRVWTSHFSHIGGATVIIDWRYGIEEDTGGSHYPLEFHGSGDLYTGDPSRANSGDARTGDIAPYIQLLACQKS